MVSSTASTVDAYLASLPPERRAAIERVRQVINANLPPGYSEGMAFGMIGWCVPLTRYADTYNGQPLGVVALASQKQSMSIYLNSVYGDPALAAEFEAAWRRTGKKLDMGKSCVRFKKVEDLALEVIADVVSRVGVDEFVARYEAVRGSARQQRAAAVASATTKTAAKKSTKTAAKKSTKTAAAKKSTKSAVAKKSTKAAAKKSTKTAAAKKSTKSAAAKKSTKTAAKKTAAAKKSTAKKKP